MKIKYTHIADPETEKIHDTAIAFAKLPPIFRSVNNTQTKFDNHTLYLLERDKEKGIILSYEIIDEN